MRLNYLLSGFYGSGFFGSSRNPITWLYFSQYEIEKDFFYFANADYENVLAYLQTLSNAANASLFNLQSKIKHKGYKSTLTKGIGSQLIAQSYQSKTSSIGAKYVI
jgi:hypothetical protein